MLKVYKPWKDAKWKKPDTEGHISYDPIYEMSRIVENQKVN